MQHRNIALALVYVVACASCSNDKAESVASVSQAVTLPGGFTDATVGTGWNQATGMLFATDGRLFVWEKAGKVWIVENGVKAATPFIDLSEEVGNWRDFGLLGFALHPDFYDNGYVYLLYEVDYYHLKNYGTAGYRPVAANLDKQHDTIGRLVRYTAEAKSGYRSVDLASRKVLVGESISTGFPILHLSHGVGSIVFGADGTLLATCGDGASYSTTDTGGHIGGSSNTALADGIIDAKQDVGSYRAQLVDSLSGKVIRVDPVTGDGIPSNPFYDATAPRAARSRVWAMGLRNPYRMTLRPGTGGHHPSEGAPGTLYVGDVGYNTYEELDIARAPATNFGWPAYEGLTANTDYMNNATANRDAPNPLFGTTPAGQPACTQSYFTFQNLLVQETLSAPSFPNSCAPSSSIPRSLPTFMHTRPALDWKHGTRQARTGTFSNAGVAQVIGVGEANSPVIGAPFQGNCSTGGVWYTGNDFPADYKNTYFHGDFGGKWIKNIVLDANDRPSAVRDFVPLNQAAVVAIATHPIDGGIYFIDYGATVHKISYTGGGNKPPVAKASADVAYGAAPLVVHFSASGSSDPEMGVLTYDWDFGDSSAHATDANPAHTFVGSGAASFTVTLTVKDVAGAKASTALLIAINDTPPVVTITNPIDGALYGMLAPTHVNLTATIADAEHGVGQRTCAWQTILHHNEHTHPEPIVSTCAAESDITPLGCDGNTYFYEFQLTVTDAAGLSTVKSVEMHPDCVCYPNGLGPIACTTPPDACHAAAGTCASGACSYAPIVCTTPPDACHVAAGTCASGACSYAPIACNAPPDECHEALGTCASGSCSYPANTGRACSLGRCQAGVCVPVVPEGGAPGEGGESGEVEAFEAGRDAGGEGARDAAADAGVVDVGVVDVGVVDVGMADDVIDVGIAESSTDDRALDAAVPDADRAPDTAIALDAADVDVASADALSVADARVLDARVDGADAGRTDGASSDQQGNPQEEGGCGCRLVPRSDRSAAWMLATLAFPLLVRRRRRRSTHLV
ncbi:MAG TPA: PQQ-dependent sugar dehydrogenase [Polyangiaceae bacterium]|nr:PQQ-dependent sugar dehydrogenase [Polyangiaceae bacterium]